MSNRRQRMTWRDRQASPPPATPGYGTEDGDHPAAQPDPGADDYKNGDTSSWAEDPHPPPYVNSAAPATPGYGTENQDHPAYKKATLEQQVAQKAAATLRVASALLGPDAPAEAVENQALDLMDLPVRSLFATLKRLSGDFLACGDDMMADQNEADWFYTAMGPDAPMGMAPMSMGDDMEGDDEEMLAQLFADEEMGDEMESMVPMAQGAQGGQGMYGQFPVEDDMGEEMGEDMYARWASLGFGRDGFAKKADWVGSSAVFDAIDTDADGIITATEYREALSPVPNPLYAGLDSEESAMLGEMLKQAEDEEEEDKEEEDEESKTAADDEEEEAEEEEDDESKTAADDEEEDDEEEDEGAEKEASIFSMMGDPMGLSDESATTPQEDALLAEIFDGKTAGDDEEEEESEEEEEEESEEESDDDEEEKEASKKKASRLRKAASRRPKARKPSTGVKALGTVSKVASGSKNEIDELSKLWESSPDVSDVFA